MWTFDAVILQMAYLFAELGTLTQMTCLLMNYLLIFSNLIHEAESPKHKITFYLKL